MAFAASDFKSDFAFVPVMNGGEEGITAAAIFCPTALGEGGSAALARAPVTAGLDMAGGKEGATPSSARIFSNGSRQRPSSAIMAGVGPDESLPHKRKCYKKESKENETTNESSFTYIQDLNKLNPKISPVLLEHTS